jgi:hypothetical protein
MKKNIAKILIVVLMLTTILSIAVNAGEEPPDPKIITPIVEVK